MRSVPVAGLILAAGKGTRMKSDLPKCLHSVCGLPMVEHVGRSLRAAGVERPIVVIGHGAELMRDSLKDSPYDFALQAEQLGTAHAVMMGTDFLKDHHGPVIVALGDVPLLTPEIFTSLVDLHLTSHAKVTIATCELDNPQGYGRIQRDAKGNVCKIVEQKDAEPDQLRIKEINTGLFCFDAQTLLNILPTLNNHNAQGEFYITDVVERVHNQGGVIETIIFKDWAMFQGVNDRWQLAEVGHVMRERILRAHATNGVTIVDPATTYIGFDVEIGVETVIHPMTTIEGKTTIGEACHIGPQSVIIESQIEDSCVVLMSHVNRATMRSGSRCGPFAHLRPLAELGERAKIGNFVEIKNARLAEGVAVNHLSYIGDAIVGERSNIGAGTITCNYDGEKKHLTQIGANVFVGSNSTLVAPLVIGNDAYVGAGSVVTDQVPDGALALGRSRQVVKEGWALRRKTR